MKVFNKDEVLNYGPLIIKHLKKSVFIYPTDTIYGIGCDATDYEAVNKIRTIKERFDMPFSVIAPSKRWIRENCVVSAEAEKWIEKLPGPYTLILSLKNKSAVAENVNFGSGTIGVRIPDNWFYDIIETINVPIVTTSANKAGKDFMTSIEDMDSEISHQVNFVIDDGHLHGRPSKLVFLTEDVVTIKER